MLLSALVGLTLILTPQYECADVRTDSWLRTPPRRAATPEPINVGAAMMVRQNEAEALLLLEDNAAAPLTPSQADYFGGGDVRPDNGALRPFLVRAVGANERTHLQSVALSNGNLFVTTGSLGCVAQVRRAVIVYLEEAPRAVFTAARTAF